MVKFNGGTTFEDYKREGPRIVFEANSSKTNQEDVFLLIHRGNVPKTSSYPQGLNVSGMHNPKVS